MWLITLPADRRLERLATPGCIPKQVLFSLRQELVELKFIIKTCPRLSSPSCSCTKKSLPPDSSWASLSLSNCRQAGLALGSGLRLWVLALGMPFCGAYTYDVCCENGRGGHISVRPGGRRSGQRRAGRGSSGGHVPSSLLRRRAAE